MRTHLLKLKELFQTPAGRRTLLEFVLGNYLYPSIAILVIVYGALAWDKNYFSYQNFRNLMMSLALSTLTAGALMITTLVGQIDASTRGVSGLISVILGVLFQLNGWPVLPSLIVVVIIATLMGLATSVMVVDLKVNGLIATLALVSVYIGIAMFFHNNQMIAVNRPQLQDVIYHDILGLPATVWFAIATLVVLYVILNHTRLGAHIYAIGANPYAATVSGVPVKRVTRTTLVISAVLVAVAGVFSTARAGLTLLYGSTGGINWNLGPVILGGVSIFGGVGRIENILLALIFGAVQDNGMNILDMRTAERYLISGVTFLGALIINVTYLRMRKLLRD